VRHAGPDATPPPPDLTPPPPRLAPPPPPRPPRRTTIPPPLPPAVFTPGPPLPDSPFDIPPTPGPIASEEFPPTPPPLSSAFAAARPPYAPGPPPGLPRPSGYLAPGGFSPGVRPPAAPPPVYDPGSSGFNFNAGFNPGSGGFNLAPPETIDFGADTIPVAETRRSGPPGLVILIVLIGAAIGGAKLGQLATRADLAALEAQTAAARSEGGAVPTTARPAPDHK
jgi:hypothetical protein